MKFTFVSNISLFELKQLIPNLVGYCLHNIRRTRFNGEGDIPSNTLIGFQFQPFDDIDIFEQDNIFMISGLSREDECVIKLKGCAYYTLPDRLNNRIKKAITVDRHAFLDAEDVAQFTAVAKGANLITS